MKIQPLKKYDGAKYPAKIAACLLATAALTACGNGVSTAGITTYPEFTEETAAVTDLTEETAVGIAGDYAVTDETACGTEEIPPEETAAVTEFPGEVIFTEETELAGKIVLPEETELVEDAPFLEETELVGDVVFIEETEFVGLVVPPDESKPVCETDKPVESETLSVDTAEIAGGIMLPPEDGQ